MITILKSIHWNPPVQGLWRFHIPPAIGTCRYAKNFEFSFDCSKNVFQWTKKNHLGHFDWNCLGSRYPIRPNTQNMVILAENRRLMLKVMLRGPKLWVSVILNVIGVHLRFIGTHFDHNRYIIRIFIFFYRSLWSHVQVSDPRPCLLKIPAVLEIALFKTFRCVVGVHFVCNCV